MKVTRIIPSCLQANLTGAKMCDKGVSKVRLVYVDDTEATVPLSRIHKNCDWSDWFSIVDHVEAAIATPKVTG